MKQYYINKLLENIYIPEKIVRKKIEENSEFPIFKTSQKTFFSQKTNQEECITEFICSKCGNEFTIKGYPASPPQCPKCKNQERFISPNILHKTSDDFTFSKDYSIKTETIDSEENEHFVFANFYHKPDTSNRTLSVHDPLILNKHIIDGITFFVLTEHEFFFCFNEITGEKSFIFPATYNAIIFSPTEIINIRNGKVSAASFERSYNQYCYFSKLIVSDKTLISELIQLIKTYPQSNGFSSAIFSGDVENFYFLELSVLDNIKYVLKSSKSPSSTAIKKQTLIKSIIENLPELKPIKTTEDNVYYTVVEKNEISRLQKIEYICPDCGETITDIVDYNRFYKSTEDTPFFCNNCGIVLDIKKFRNARDYNSKINVSIVSDYEDGIIIFDAPYIVSIKNGKKYFFPTLKKFYPSDIVIIKKEFDRTNLLANTIILRKIDDTPNYSIAKKLKIEFDNFSDVVNNTASHFNLQWTGIEHINKNRGNAYSASVHALAGFILLFRKYPVMEKFIKENQQEILINILSNFNWDTSISSTRYSLEQNNIPAALYLSKGCMRILNNPAFSGNKLNIFIELQSLYNTDKNITAENFAYIKEHGVSIYKIIDICKNFNLTIHQICEYLERVRITQCVSPSIAISEWCDYLMGCKTIKSDLSDRKVKYPAALRTEHDKVMYKKRIVDNEQYEQKFQAVTKEYGKKYSYKNENFIITYPKTLQDLFEEGRRLNHCVGSYGDTIKNGNSIILFVRKADAPDTPYFTLEVNPSHNAVTQFYGHSDTPPHKIKHKELILFIRDWALKHQIFYNP